MDARRFFNTIENHRTRFTAIVFPFVLCLLSSSIVAQSTDVNRGLQFVRPFDQRVIPAFNFGPIQGSRVASAPIGNPAGRANPFPIGMPAARLSGNINLTPENRTAGVTNISKGLEVLPNDAGQVWRTYDIKPYTERIKQERPQQAIIDWIIRETGTNSWFSEPFGLLNASKDQLHVYHTKPMQERVAKIVDRLVGSKAEPEIVGMRLVTLGNPNWRARAFHVMEGVDVNTPGISAWLLSKENAAILFGELRKRADFQQHNAPHVAIASGQNYVLQRQQPRSFPKSLSPSNRIGFYDLKMGSINEGFRIELSPLRTIDGKSMETMIRCDIDQIEKFQKVNLEFPGLNGQLQSAEIQVPQVVSWRVRERFRWPADRVLLLSCGVVASPAGRNGSIFQVPKLLNAKLKSSGSSPVSRM